MKKKSADKKISFYMYIFFSFFVLGTTYRNDHRRVLGFPTQLPGSILISITSTAILSYWHLECKHGLIALNVTDQKG